MQIHINIKTWIGLFILIKLFVDNKINNRMGQEKCKSFDK